jgi:Spy/CpxP family protein refolding chaperone
MRAIAWLVLGLLLPATALAQTPDQRAASPPPGQLPLGAMLHHQPTQAQVDARERARQGAKQAEQQQRRQRTEEDRLYQEIMRRSAPSTSGNGP